MIKESMFDRIGSELKRLLNLPESFPLQFLIGDNGEEFYVRLQGPHREGLDCEDYRRTKDILGLGASMSEAVADACSLYRKAMAEEVVFSRELVSPPKFFQH